jgi:hypothetical protein
MTGCHRTHEGGIGFSRRKQVEAVSGNSDSPPLPPLAGLLQGSLSPGAPPASLVGIGAGLARIRRAGFGEAGVDAFGLTLRFDSPARVRSSIVASGASFLMERIPAMADALASYASEVAITCPLGERRTKRNFPVVPFLITNLPGISAPFPAARLRRSPIAPGFWSPDPLTHCSPPEAVPRSFSSRSEPGEHE